MTSPRVRRRAIAALLVVAGPAAAAPTLTPLGDAPRQWARSEFTLAGVNNAGANPYDPDQIALDAVVTAPDGSRAIVPLFWYAGFSRALKTDDAGKPVEVVTPDAATPGEWRLRWTPRVAGRHTLDVRLTRGNQTTNVASLAIDAGAKAADAHGFVAVDPASKRYFKTDDGRPLPLFGLNADWPSKRGTYDYDDWLPAMGHSGLNATRIWMGNAGFHCELYADERLHYSQPTLWQLDTVLDEAAKNGVDVMLCLDFHGEFQTEKDSWGHSGWWSTHAYQLKNGGPCYKPNDFFTNADAAALYRKRLRYLVARYSANTNLLAWEFFNEVDNIYGDAKADRQTVRDKNRLYPPDVVAWHGAMSQYLHSIDPYAHAETTSFGSAGLQPAMWQLPGLDFACWHWYTNWGGPYKGVTQMTAGVGKDLIGTFDKPVLITEFGTDGYGWAPDNDAGRRGFRQALWGGVFSGTAGTAMPWWWESVAKENLLPLWTSLRNFLPADFGSAKWKVVSAFRPAPAGPPTLGKPADDAQSFSQRINLTTKWGKGPGTPVVVNRPGDDGEGALSGYVLGRAKPELHAPYKLLVNAGPHATLTLHLNSVAADSRLVVEQNGQVIFARDLPNKDNKSERNHEYDENVVVPLKPGRAEIEIANTGVDWLFLDYLRVDGALEVKESSVAPADVPLEKYVLSDGRTRLLWVVDGRYSWPHNRTRPDEPLDGATLILDGWPDGDVDVVWWDTAAGRECGRTRATARGGTLRLAPPAFRGDVAARLTPAG